MKKPKKTLQNCQHKTHKINKNSSLASHDSTGKEGSKLEREITTRIIITVGVLVRVIIFRFPGSSLLHGDFIGESFLLPLTSFMVLKPIKYILAFNLAVLSKPSRDLLNLSSIWGPNTFDVVQFLQNSYLVSSGIPPCTGLPAKKVPFGATVIILIWLLLVRFHDGLRSQNKTKGREQNILKRGLISCEKCKRWGS
jgi:hypothetical protein